MTDTRRGCVNPRAINNRPYGAARSAAIRSNRRSRFVPYLFTLHYSLFTANAPRSPVGSFGLRPQDDKTAALMRQYADEQCSSLRRRPRLLRFIKTKTNALRRAQSDCAVKGVFTRFHLDLSLHFPLTRETAAHTASSAPRLMGTVEPAPTDGGVPAGPSSAPPLWRPSYRVLLSRLRL